MAEEVPEKIEDRRLKNISRVIEFPWMYVGPIKRFICGACDYGYNFVCGSSQMKICEIKRFVDTYDCRLSGI